MKSNSLRFILLGLVLVAACSQAASEPPNEAAPTPTAGATSTTETASEPTEQEIQIPTGRLLVTENGDQYYMVNFPDLTVQPYEALNSEEEFHDWSAVLSPDGRHLAYRRSWGQNFGQHTLYLLDTATGETTQIADYSKSNGAPTWTADGRFLIFDNFDQGFYKFDVETGELSHLASSSEFSDQSAVSPDGQRIAFAGGCPGTLIACPVDLYVINSDGTREEFLEPGDMDWIFWSSDSKLIYYSLFGDREAYGNSGEREDAGYRLYSLDLETGLSTPIEDPEFNTSAYASTFQSPDGQYLSYVFGNAGLKVIRVSDKSMVALLPPGTPIWTGDSRYVLLIPYSGSEWVLLDVMSSETKAIESPQGFSLLSPVGWLP